MFEAFIIVLREGFEAFLIANLPLWEGALGLVALALVMVGTPALWPASTWVMERLHGGSARSPAA